MNQKYESNASLKPANQLSFQTGELIFMAYAIWQ
jgi:hypothetical protein